MALFPATWPALLALAIIVGGFAAALWRRYPMAYSMALLSIGVFAVQALSTQFVRCQLNPLGFRADCVIAELSFIAPLFFLGDRVLTPFTYMFVHADILHIAGNMFILLTAGPALEERIGSRNFLIIYFLAGFTAVAATVGLWQVGFFQGGQEFSPNVGASGAIFGVLTGFAVLYPKEKLPMMLPMMFFIFWMPAFTVLLLYLGINLVYIVSNTNIAWWGHFGGFIAGLALAPMLAKRLPARKVAKALDLDLDALRPLAKTNIQQSALRELERLREPKTHDDRKLAEAWWEKFMARAECPVCQRRLSLQELRLACDEGHYEVQALRR